MSERGLVNTWDQLAAFGGGLGIFYTSPDRGRGGHPMGFSVCKVNADRTETPTRLDAPWYDRKHMAWVCDRQTKAATLAKAQAWVAEKYGERGPWVRNRMGDYIPERINKAFPLPPRRQP